MPNGPTPYWRVYDDCATCGMPAGQQCVVLDNHGRPTGEPKAVRHPGRPRLTWPTVNMRRRPCGACRALVIDCRHTVSTDRLTILNAAAGRCGFCGGESTELEPVHVVYSARRAVPWLLNAVAGCRCCRRAKAGLSLGEWVLNEGAPTEALNLWHDRRRAGLPV